MFGAGFFKQEKQQQVRRLDHLRGMSSGAKRLVQSLRGRNVTTSNNSSSNNNNNNNNNSGSNHHLHQHHRSGSGSSHDIGGGASASTSATRLFDRYDSGHELDEISVIGRSGPDDYTAAATTPTTPYHQQQQQQLHHHYSSGGAAPISPAATVIGGVGGSSLGSVGLNKQYDSRQTLYSIAGSMPNSQASGAAGNNRLITPAGIVTAGGSIVTSGELRERHRQTATRSGSCASGRLIDDDLDDLDETRSGGGVFSSRQSFIDLVSSKIISNTRTPTHFYHHQPQLQSSGGGGGVGGGEQYFGSSRDSLHHQQAYVNRGASELDLSSRGGKDKAARQLGIKDSRVAAASSKAAAARSNFKLANCNTGMQTNNCMLNSSGAMMNTATTTTTMTTIPSREMTPSHLSVTPSSINHLVGNSACNGTETRYSYQQQQQQRGSRGYPGQSGQRGFRTGAPNWSFVFDPAGRLCYYWSMVVSLAFLYNFWVIIYRFAFQEINGETIVVWFCLDYLSDFLYVADIVFHFRTGYLEDGVLQTDATKLSQHYMNSTTFYIDCLCLLPLDFLYLSIGFNSILRSFRLVKIYRFWAFMDRTERHTNYPNLFRSTSLIHYLLVIFHWNGCLYHIIYKNNGFGSKDWVFADSETADVVKQYLQSYYWCTLALTTIGDLPRPRTKGEYLFVIAQLLFGLLLFATVLGHVANIVTSVSAARKEFQAKLDGVKTYMRMRRVPNHLQVKVIKWFDYLWLTQKCSDEEKAVSCLPDKLKAEIAINVHLDTLKRVEIFQNTEAGFLCELVLRLRPVLFSPGDYICRKGEVGKEMYIVNRGRLQVVADNGKTVLATLKAGSYFGEISILNMGTAGKECGNRRTASVRSVGYSDLFVLSKKDMWDVLKEYPAARVRLEAIAVKRLEKYKRAPLEKAAMGRCMSTPGLVESRGRIPLEEMMVSTLDVHATGGPPLSASSAFSPNPSPLGSRSVGHQPLLSSVQHQPNLLRNNLTTATTTMTTPAHHATLTDTPRSVATTAPAHHATGGLRNAAGVLGDSPTSPASSVHSSEDPNHRLQQAAASASTARHSGIAYNSTTQLLSSASVAEGGTTPVQQQQQQLQQLQQLQLQQQQQLSQAAGAYGAEPLLAEIKRLRDRLVCLEAENASMSLKLNQKQYEVESRLAEIEMQICGGSSTSSIEDNERNRESII